MAVEGIEGQYLVGDAACHLCAEGTHGRDGAYGVVGDRGDALALTYESSRGKVSPLADQHLTGHGGNGGVNQGSSCRPTDAGEGAAVKKPILLGKERS